jgi:hypothetical protein
MTLSIRTLSMLAENCYAECCLFWLSLMQSFTYKPLMLNVVMLSVVAPHSGTLLANVRLGWKTFQRQIVLFSEIPDTQVNVFVSGKFSQLRPGNTKGEVSLYCWPPVWLVWNWLYDYWKCLFLFAKQTNPNSQTGGQQYSDTFSISIPCLGYHCVQGRSSPEWNTFPMLPLGKTRPAWKNFQAQALAYFTITSTKVW